MMQNHNLTLVMRLNLIPFFWLADHITVNSHLEDPLPHTSLPSRTRVNASIAPVAPSMF
jgi:hypothetical protein